MGIGMGRSMAAEVIGSPGAQGLGTTLGRASRGGSTTRIVGCGDTSTVAGGG